MDDEPAMIFAGDAAYTQENIDRQIVGGVHLDPTAAVESIRRLKRRAQGRKGQIFPSHEMAPFLPWKKAPNFYGRSPAAHPTGSGRTRKQRKRWRTRTGG